MNCDLARQELTALDRGELSAAEAETVRRHVAGCTPCASELRRLRRVRSLFVGATAIAPSAAGSSRLRAALDEAIRVEANRVQANGRAASAGAVPDGASDGARVIDLWSRFRRRYEQSAAVRRFTVASIGIHAAAAALLAVALSTGEPAAPRESVVTFDPTAIAQAPDDVHSAPAGLAAFDAATTDGVRGASGRAFPNAATAARLGVVCDPREARLALTESMGPDADLVAAATARGLAWIASQQRADGGYGDVEDTALAIQAHAASGRSSATDAGLGRAVAALEARVLDEALPVATQAEGVRALVQQYGVDFGTLTPEAREARRGTLARAGRRLADAQRADGAFGSVADTVAATVALAEIRTAGVLETGTQVLAAQRWIDGRRSQDGLVLSAVGADSAALSATVVDVEAMLGRARVAPAGAVRIAQRAASSTSVSSAAAGIGALRAVGAPVRDAVRRVARAQGTDGTFADGKRSRVAATAAGVVALARAVR